MRKLGIFNIANLLSFSRILLSVPLVISMMNLNEGSSLSDLYIFLFICLLIAVTDVLDGYFARKFDVVTELGKILDPVADKICSLILILFLSSKFSEFYNLFLSLILRDILISVATIYFIKADNKYFQANALGKWFLFFLAMTMLLFSASIVKAAQFSYINEIKSFFYTVTWVFFVLSTYDYFSGYIKHYKRMF